MDLDDFKENTTAEDFVHEKPCRICRKRKVRCSKTDPCSNCERAGNHCEYDDQLRNDVKPTRTVAALNEKVAQLEAMVQNLSSQLASNASHSTKPHGSGSQRKPIFLVDEIYQSLIVNTTGRPFDAVASFNGRLLWDEGSSRHLMNTFWASQYDEIGSLKFMLREEQRQDSALPWSHQSLGLTSDHPFAISLSQAGSDYLMQAFMKNVDQFVRVLHKPTVLKQLNHFRRGILPECDGFQGQLSAIYSLAALSISEDDSMMNFGVERATLLQQFRADVERSLAHLNITTTHKISTLQTFLLHISYLVWTGEILHASSLLALAVRTAQRLGLHRDGKHFNLSPWQTELRRRIWHHIMLIDTWCMENHGLESAIPYGFSDTQLPQNLDDRVWDVSDASTVEPGSQHGFTDMTFALMEYESAALIRTVLKSNLPVTGEEEAYTAFHSQLQQQTWSRIEHMYLSSIDEANPRQRLVLEIARLTFKRVQLTQLRPLTRSSMANPRAMKELESKLVQLSLEFCDQVQQVRKQYQSYQLDWAIIRVFSWHALATELSTVLRSDCASKCPEARKSLEKIAKIFCDRPHIDYLKNVTLWEPLDALHDEFQMKQLVDVGMEQQQWGHGGAMPDPFWDDTLLETF